MKVLDQMTPCQCGHPLWCHATSIRHPDFVSIEETPDVPPYVQGEPDECNHIGPGGWDCDCLVFVILPTFSAESDASQEVIDAAV